jgi:hypothetical protein
MMKENKSNQNGVWVKQMAVLVSLFGLVDWASCSSDTFPSDGEAQPPLILDPQHPDVDSETLPRHPSPGDAIPLQPSAQARSSPEQRFFEVLLVLADGIIAGLQQSRDILPRLYADLARYQLDYVNCIELCRRAQVRGTRLHESPAELTCAELFPPLPAVCVETRLPHSGACDHPDDVSDESPDVDPFAQLSAAYDNIQCTIALIKKYKAGDTALVKAFTTIVKGCSSFPD